MAIVNTNFNSVFGSVQLARIERAIGQATVRISSGSKLNNSGDNPSGVIAASWFKARVSGIGQAEFNATDTESMLKVADSAINEINDYLLAMRDLALRAANDATLSAADFTSLNTEYQGYLTDARDRGNDATFNGRMLLDGSYYSAGRRAQVGPGSSDSITVTIDDIENTLTTTVAGTTITNAANAAAALTQIDNSIAASQAEVGGFISEMGARLEGLGNQEINMTAALSNITDADMAAEISRFAQLQILSQSSTAVLAQANSVTERIISILDKM
jgi:flagellin